MGIVVKNDEEIIIVQLEKDEEFKENILVLIADDMELDKVVGCLEEELINQNIHSSYNDILVIKYNGHNLFEESIYKLKYTNNKIDKTNITYNEELYFSDEFIKYLIKEINKIKEGLNIKKYYENDIIKVKNNKTGIEHYGVILKIDKLKNKYQVRLPKDLIEVSANDIISKVEDEKILNWFRKMEFREEINTLTKEKKYFFVNKIKNMYEEILNINIEDNMNL